MSPTSTLRLTGELIAVATGGDLVRGPGISADEGACIDSRTARRGQVFFALKGPRFDAHDFLDDALARGVSGVVVRADRAAEAMTLVASRGEAVFIVAVEDPEKALQDSARAWCRILTPRVVGITGSVGKTTVKDMTRAVAASRFETHATYGNQNNFLGLSLTCLGLLPRHQVLVAEMGMSALGEIAGLCEIAPPGIGVVTRIAPVHLETLGSIEQVARAKAEIVEALPADGVAVLNRDDERVRTMASRTKAQVIEFGTDPGARVQVLDVSMDLGGKPVCRWRVDGQVVEGRLSLSGRHQALNGAAALAVGLALGVPPEVAVEALGNVAPGRHRLQEVGVGTLRILDDCYNASPVSMEAALATLAQMAAGRRVAVLGDMLELGDLTLDAHREAGRQAVRHGVDLLVAIGDHRAAMREGAVGAGMSPSRVFEAKDAIEGATVVAAIVQPRDTVLVKASRAVGLEKVIEALVRRFQTETTTQGE